MDHQLPFVGHQSELAYIDSVIRDWGTRRILFVDAAAGMGKTRLLQEIRHRHAQDDAEKIPLLIPDSIDFENPALRKLHNLGCKVAHALGKELFAPYLRVLLNWRRMELSGAGIEQLHHASLAVNQTFVGCFHMLSSRVVFLVDNIDAVRDTDVLEGLSQTVRHMENVVVIATGRNTQTLSQHLQDDFGKEVQTISLLPLPKHDAETYSHHKQHMLSTSIEPDLMQKIIYLSHGKPLLLDLAGDMCKHGTIPDWLHTATPHDLQAGSENEQAHNHQAFIRQLVQHITDINQLKGWLTLLMARIFPLDVPMIQELLAVPEDSARTLFERAQKQAIVKQTPDGRIALHDDIRHVVQKYVWPEVDPEGERMRRTCLQTAHYLGAIMEHMTAQLDEVKAAQKAAVESEEMGLDSGEGRYDTRYAHAACDPFVRFAALSEELDKLKVRELYHTLVADAAAGVATFGRLFDEATQTYAFRLRRMLLAEVDTFADVLGPSERYAIESRRVCCFMDDVDYGQARELAKRLLQEEELTPEQQIDMLIQGGNAAIRLGAIDESIADFERAMDVSKEHELERWAIDAQRSRGWAYFHQGRYDLAMTDYIDAYQHSIEMDETEQTAWLLTHIGFIHALRGDRQAALESCFTAQELWEQLQLLRGKGAAYTTLGEAYMRFNQPTEALSYYNKALDIFTTQGDVEWVCLVRCGRAHVFQARGEFDKAEGELQWSYVHGPLNLRPRIFYTQAQTFLARGDVGNARYKFEECRRVSQKIGDCFHDYKSFADLLELAWDCDECARWREFADEHAELFAEREGVDALRLRGSCLRKIGDLAICSGEYATALECYKEGLPLIARHEVYERYTIRTQIRQTDERLRKRISPTMLHRLGQDLGRFWREQPELLWRYPEVLLLFSRW